jgi:2-polyprenyl-6-methoxyphenol hydroxylase-like FAD-dependent oxidoreductase
MENKKVIISGAGIAGLTLAYWLDQYGFSPVMIEKRPDLTEEGYMIDFLGPGFDVAEKMGLMGPLRLKAYQINQTVLVDQHGQEMATLDLKRIRNYLDNRFINLTRGDLETVLYESICKQVPVRFQTQIQQIVEQPDHVQVMLSNGEVQEAAMLIGADGIHSHIRSLYWGEAGQFEHFLGYYIACAVFENFLQRKDTYYSYLAPKTQAAVYSIRGNRLATLFAIKSALRDTKSHQAQQEVLKEAFGRQGWIVPQLLEGTLQSDHLYFDTVSQVEVDPWYKGRVALVGDACQCLTLLAGQGASMAMYGAYVLASALHDAQGDYTLAFPMYQEKMRPLIEKQQAKARKLTSSFIPNNRFEVRLTALALKAALLPGLRSIFLKQFGEKKIAAL